MIIALLRAAHMHLAARHGVRELTHMLRSRALMSRLTGNLTLSTLKGFIHLDDKVVDVILNVNQLAVSLRPDWPPDRRVLCSKISGSTRYRCTRYTGSVQG